METFERAFDLKYVFERCALRRLVGWVGADVNVGVFGSLAGIEEAHFFTALEVEGGLADELVVQIDGVALEVADEADAVPGFGF